MAGPILLLSGVPGTGKSSLARSWLRSVPLGLHLPVDDLRELVVSGLAHPSLTGDPEATRQFTLARRSAFGTAGLYARAGFAVAIDDVLWPHDPDDLQTELLPGFPSVRVFLAAPLDTVLRRNRERTSKAFAPELLEPVIRHLHGALRPELFAAAGWHVLDTGGRTMAEALAELSALTAP